MTGNNIAPSRRTGPYSSPKIAVIFVNMQGILCQSKPDAYNTEMQEGDNNW